MSKRYKGVRTGKQVEVISQDKVKTVFKHLSAHCDIGVDNCPACERYQEGIGLTTSMFNELYREVEA